MFWQILGYFGDDEIELLSENTTYSIYHVMGVHGICWLLNGGEDPLQIGAYQVEEVHGKLHKVRTDKHQWTRRPDAGIGGSLAIQVTTY